MLLQVLDFIQRENIASFEQLCREFQIEEQALQPILDIWLRKGRVYRVDAKGSCQNPCQSCKKNAAYYQAASE